MSNAVWWICGILVELRKQGALLCSTAFYAVLKRLHPSSLAVCYRLFCVSCFYVDVTFNDEGVRCLWTEGNGGERGATSMAQFQSCVNPG